MSVYENHDNKRDCRVYCGCHECAKKLPETLTPEWVSAQVDALNTLFDEDEYPEHASNARDNTVSLILWRISVHRCNDPATCAGLILPTLDRGDPRY